MKKLIATVTALSLVLGMCAGLAGCKKDDDTVDTFTGVASEETYESVEAAATAFLANEVGGGVLPTVFVGYEKTGDLSENEISELSLTDADRADLERAESGIAKYSAGSEEAAAVAEEGETGASVAEETYSQRLYILLFKGNVYRYYVPKLAVGEWVTKSYYDSVMDVKKYKNCTMTHSGLAWNEVEEDVWVQEPFEETYMLSEEAEAAKGVGDFVFTGESYCFKYSGFIYYAYRDLTNDPNASWEIDKEDDDGSLDNMRNGEGNLFSLSESVGISDFAYMDFTFFQKTANGMRFAIPERCNKYLRGNYYESDDYLYSKHIRMIAEAMKAVTVKVKDGRVEEITIEVNEEWAENHGGCSVSAAPSQTFNFDSFGTTKVEIPQEIIDLISKEE